MYKYIYIYMFLHIDARLPGSPITAARSIQPVPTKTRLEMVIGMQNEIFDGQSSGLFSNEPFERKSLTTIEDFVLHSADHIESRLYIESHLLGNGLYMYVQTYV